MTKFHNKDLQAAYDDSENLIAEWKEHLAELNSDIKKLEEMLRDAAMLEHIVFVQLDASYAIGWAPNEHGVYRVTARVSQPCGEVEERVLLEAPLKIRLMLSEHLGRLLTSVIQSRLNPGRRDYVIKA